MKCVICGSDTLYRVRLQIRRCGSCGQRLVFEPKTDRLTDLAFWNAVRHVSDEGTLRWQFDHLYYELARTFASKRTIRLSKRTRFTRVAASAFLSRWMEVWQVVGLLADPSPAYQPILDLRVPLDQVSFERVIVCDQARTAAFLIANNVHLEHRCPVVAMDHYPQPTTQAVMAQLRRHPPARVWAFHDATPEGCGLAHHLATSPSWFADEVRAGETRIVDLGLMPSQTRTYKGVWQPRAGPPPPAAGLQHDELRWLKRYSLGLAAIRPRAQLVRVARAMSGTGLDLPPELLAPSAAPTAAAAADTTRGDGTGSDFLGALFFRWSAGGQAGEETDGSVDGDDQFG